MFAIGAGSGFLAGIFGVGGGILTVPSISLATDLGHKEVRRDTWSLWWAIGSLRPLGNAIADVFLAKV